MVLAALMATKADPTLWYVTRLLAVSGYIALSVAVALGLIRSLARVFGEGGLWALDELHRFATILAAALIAGHLLTLLFDPFLPFTPLNLVVPVNEPYKPLAVDLGVLALYGLAALLLSSWARGQLSYGFWRAIHYVSFPIFALVTLHGWFTGSDSVTTWMPIVYAASGAGIAFLTAIRVVEAVARGSNPAVRSTQR